MWLERTFPFTLRGLAAFSMVWLVGFLLGIIFTLWLMAQIITNTTV